MFCKNCGIAVTYDEVYCHNCGAALKPTYEERAANAKNEDRSTLGTIALVFAIISCVIMGFALFPLAWAVPMTVSMSRKLKNGQPISVGFKVCTLLFLNSVSGILLLTINDKE